MIEERKLQMQKIASLSAQNSRTLKPNLPKKKSKKAPSSSADEIEKAKMITEINEFEKQLLKKTEDTEEMLDGKAYMKKIKTESMEKKKKATERSQRNGSAQN